MTVTFSDEQLWAAVRSVGGGGQSFTCATVRESLGLSTTKRQELAQFRDRFRTFRLAAGSEIQKVGKSAYRLKPVAAAAPEVVEVSEASEAPAAVEIPEVVAPPEVVADIPVDAAAPAFSSPLAVDDGDMGFGEPMSVIAADSGELAANHVIFSAWPESMLPAAEPAPATESTQTEAEIEAQVRELVALPEVPAASSSSDSVFGQAEQAVIRTWRDGARSLGRRFAGLFTRH